MNEKIRKTLVDQAGYWPNVEFADFTPEMGNINFYRWPETQYTDAPDPVHLSEMGVQEPWIFIISILGTPNTGVRGVKIKQKSSEGDLSRALIF